MPGVHLRVPPDRAVFAEGFDRIRRELEIPEAFPDPVAAQAEAAARRGPIARGDPGGVEPRDGRELELVTIDPPGSLDLDQAYHAERRGDGYRVHYAIADLASFVDAGDAVDIEAHARGVTLYSPDRRASLHPETLSEGAASLLAGVDRVALLWSLDLDGDGELVDAHMERALVRSRRTLTYREVQDAVEADRDEPALALLCEIGAHREQREADRGGISINLPGQEVHGRPDGTYRLHYDDALPVEGWNEQISLLTGIAAAAIMVDGGVGLLRTLPPAPGDTIGAIRQTARALDLDWPKSVRYPEFIRGLDAGRPAHAALLTQALRLFRGAGYEAFDGTTPAYPAHAAIAAPYAHVTAPLRRLADRYANEVVLALCADHRPPDWVIDELPELPAVMGAARQRQSALERATVDFVEVVLLEGRVGEDFLAVVTGADDRGSTIQLRDPAVVTTVPGEALPVGQEVAVRLARVDLTDRRAYFEPASGG